MGLQIIIRGKSKYGKTRSEQEENLRKDGHATMSEEKLDKLKHLERKTETKKGFFRQIDIDKVK
jgi:hypothetical protein